MHRLTTPRAGLIASLQSVSSRLPLVGQDDSSAVSM